MADVINPPTQKNLVTFRLGLIKDACFIPPPKSIYCAAGVGACHHD